MSARTHVKRLIVCIDAEEYKPEDGTLGATSLAQLVNATDQIKAMTTAAPYSGSKA